MAEDEWLTVSEAAAFLGISRSTVLRVERRGEILADRTPGGHRRFQRSQLEFLRRQWLRRAGAA